MNRASHNLWIWSAALAIAFVSTGCQNLKEMPGFKEITPPTPAEEARNLFNVYDPDIRRRALNNLSAAPFGGEEPYVRGYRLLIDDPDPTVRAAAVKALGLHGSVDDVALIIVRMKDISALVRWEAAKALQKIHNPLAIRSLVTAVTRDDDPDVRMAAADAMGQYADPQVFNALVAALDDTQHGVVYAAAKSLKTLTGEDLGASGAKWLEWREQNPATVFAKQKDYYWEPYRQPRGFLDRAQFWKKPKEVTPQRPEGT